MTSSLWPKVLFVVIAAFAVALSGCGKSETPATATPSPVETLVDDIVRQLLQDASTVQEDIQREETAAALAAEDDTALRTIGQATETLSREVAIDLLLEELLADAATMQQQILDEEVEAALLSAEDASLQDIGGLADGSQIR